MFKRILLSKPLIIASLLLLTLALPRGGRTLEAQGPPDLEAQHQRMLPLFELAGVVFTDADETTGRFVVGVLDRGMSGLVRARLAALRMPAESVDIVETEPILPVDTLRDLVRPVEGGLQIRFSGYLCSLSFNAYRDGILGYVTASHCSDKQGAADGTLYYQPLNQVASEFIGHEIADPAFFRGANGCPKGKKCRYSDANFSAADARAGFGLGTIAKTTGANNGSLEIAGSFVINGSAQAAVGSTANKVGRTTGWTQGTVTHTCTNTGVSGSNIVLLCQDWVENKKAAIVGAGDSGSPVFATSGGNTVLLGTLWGGNSSGTQFVYSPLANIEQELGQLTIK